MYQIESKRLGMRCLEQADFNALCAFLRDDKVMYAWEHGFSENEVQKWILDNQERYGRDGFGYFALVEKSSGWVIGTMGPIMEQIDGAAEFGIGYILSRDFWGKGYAVEGVGACAEYLFRVHGAGRVICEIRPENEASIKVARKLGMRQTGAFLKEYRGIEMPHLIFELRRREWEERAGSYSLQEGGALGSP